MNATKLLSPALVFLVPILSSAPPLAAESTDPGFDRLSEPLARITEEQRAAFFEGKELFEHSFTALSDAEGPGDGGGPLNNAFFGRGGTEVRGTVGNACATCHDSALAPDGTENNEKDGGNGGFGPVQVTAWDEATGTCDHLEDLGGPGFQANLVQSYEALLASMGLSIPEQDRADAAGLDEYVPVVSSSGVPAGPVDDRTTNDLFGLGLLDAVADRTLVRLADPHDADGDGISGRVHWVVDHHGERGGGRFGRKAEIRHVDEFNAEAFQNEQGVTNVEVPSDGVIVVEDDAGNLLVHPIDDGAADPEVNEEELHALNMYVKLLAPPLPNTRALPFRERIAGQLIFRGIGCADCHTPLMRTGRHEIKALNHRLIRPYSDLLLHDMGDSLAEGCKGDARPREWRTEPLWGLRFVPNRYLHDGRAATIQEAIEMHANDADAHPSEASAAVAAFRALSDRGRTRLLNFLNTL